MRAGCSRHIRRGHVGLDFADGGTTLVVADRTAVHRLRAPELAPLSSWPTAGTRFTALTPGREPGARILGVSAGGRYLYADHRNRRLEIWDLASPGDHTSHAWPKLASPLRWPPRIFGDPPLVIGFNPAASALAVGRPDSPYIELMHGQHRVHTFEQAAFEGGNWTDDFQVRFGLDDAGERIAVPLEQHVRVISVGGAPSDLERATYELSPLSHDL